MEIQRKSNSREPGKNKYKRTKDEKIKKKGLEPGVIARGRNIHIKTKLSIMKQKFNMTIYIINPITLIQCKSRKDFLFYEEFNKLKNDNLKLYQQQQEMKI